MAKCLVFRCYNETFCIFYFQDDFLFQSHLFFLFFMSLRFSCANSSPVQYRRAVLRSIVSCVSSTHLPLSITNRHFLNADVFSIETTCGTSISNLEQQNSLSVILYFFMSRRPRICHCYY
jgi:hypothetical protein